MTFIEFVLTLFCCVFANLLIDEIKDWRRTGMTWREIWNKIQNPRQ